MEKVESLVPLLMIIGRTFSGIFLIIFWHDLLAFFYQHMNICIVFSAVCWYFLIGHIVNILFIFSKLPWIILQGYLLLALNVVKIKDNSAFRSSSSEQIMYAHLSMRSRVSTFQLAAAKEFQWMLMFQHVCLH